MRGHDAILVPGGGVREGGVLPSWVERRLDRAIELFQGQFILTLSAGTTHRPPPFDGAGFPIFESIAAAKYLTDRGIPPEKALPETCSYDTIGNAFFSRIIHTDPRGFRKLLVITSDFHLPRAEAVFTWIYNLTPVPFSYELDFESVTDPSMEQDVLRARRERESHSLALLDNLAKQIADLPSLHRWLFTEHQAYRATRGAFRHGTVGALTLQSY
jgi:hypothetical protein